MQSTKEICDMKVGLVAEGEGQPLVLEEVVVNKRYLDPQD